MSTTTADAALDPGTTRYATRYVAAYEATVRHLAALRAAGLPTEPRRVWREMIAALAPEPRGAAAQMAWLADEAGTINGISDAAKGRPAAWEAIEADNHQDGDNSHG